MTTPEQAAENFINQPGKITAVEEYGRGNIHDTFLVKLGSQAACFILQRINIQVFKRPDLVMHNLRLVCKHLHAQKEKTGSRIDPDWRMLNIIPTRDGGDFFIGTDGGFWRALSFIDNAHPMERIEDMDNAREVGRALGIFHNLTSGLNPEQLHDTLPGFHNIDHYICQYDQALLQSISRDSSKLMRFCQNFIYDRRYWAPILENNRKQGKLRERIIHGDPKISNIMLDNQTGKAVSIIDLDTVKSGLVHYDIGDCIRSCCNIPGEEADDLDTIRFDLALCEAVLSGYIGATLDCLPDGDFDYFFDAIRLIPFELGIRFFTDYLGGNTYFKIRYPSQNIDRAMVQFRLVESIEKQETAIRTVIDSCRKSCQEL